MKCTDVAGVHFKSSLVDRQVSEIVILTGRLIFIIIAVRPTVTGAFTRVLAAGGRTPLGEVGSRRIRRRTAAHPPQLVGEAPPPAAVLTNGAQEADELSSLLPIRSSLTAAPQRALLVHVGEHLTDVGGQQVVHLVTLTKKNEK